MEKEILKRELKHLPKKIVIPNLNFPTGEIFTIIRIIKFGEEEIAFEDKKGNVCSVAYSQIHGVLKEEEENE